MNDRLSSRAASFDELYQRNADPWNFDTSPYEQAKRSATLAALAGRRFSRALELGCSTGRLSQALLANCDTIIATDISPTVLETAKRNLGENEQVEFQLLEAPARWPTGSFDLIVCSEILYFMNHDEVAMCAQKAAASLAANGLCLLVNWTGENDMPLSGDMVADLFVQSAKWETHRLERADTYRIDTLHKD